MSYLEDCYNSRHSSRNAADIVEATATALQGATYHLLRKPHCLERLQKEVRNAFMSISDIDRNSSASLSYLTAVIEEALRIYPPVPIGLPRVSPGATVDGSYVPAGAIVHTPLWTLCHSPQFWHEPYDFHPERWLASDDPEYNNAFAGDDKNASKPFSVGPRACMGLNFAWVELRIILARRECFGPLPILSTAYADLVVWQFDWELVNKEYDWDRDNKMHIIWHKPPIMIRMLKRQDLKVQ